jgi:hypothetical protein
MLEGGVGAIRLKTIKLFNKHHWLMTASSDGVTHTGIPLMVPRELYVPLLPVIHEKGAICSGP